MKEFICAAPWLYLALISLISAMVTVRDKSAARRGKRRTSENTLMLLSALGGSAVMLMTMLLVRHKTKHMKFMVGIPIIILFQTVAAACIILKII